ncbi:hypothetical protein HG530_005690 [Fusarium avenaceum]|nr:hypothetical protein HG530_005690 [Fusarium avenaceum]
MDNTEPLALDPEEGSLGLDSLDVTDVVLLIEHSLLAGLDTRAKVSAGGESSDTLDLLDSWANIVSVVANVEGLAASGTVVLGRSRASRNKDSLIDVLHADGVEVLVSSPIHAGRIVVVLDVANTASLIVNSLDTSRILVADLSTGVGVPDLLDDLETASTVSVVSVTADGVVGAGLGCPLGFLGGAFGQSG